MFNWLKRLAAYWYLRPVRLKQQEAKQLALQSLITQHPEDDLQVGEHYLRVGHCTQCGKCCESIHLSHKGQFIQNVIQLKWLQLWFAEFRPFTPIGHSEEGLVFKCNALREDKTCSIYGSRPSFCRKYPSEAVKFLGRVLPEECGYDFKPIQGFSTVLNQQAELQSIP